MSRWAGSRFIRMFGAGILLLGATCNNESPGLIRRVEALKAAGTEDAEVKAVAEIVRYANEKELAYGYTVRDSKSGVEVERSEVHNHLNDELIVTIYLGKYPHYREFEWKPVANWYITRLIMH